MLNATTSLNDPNTNKIPFLNILCPQPHSQHTTWLRSIRYLSDTFKTIESRVRVEAYLLVKAYKIHCTQHTASTMDNMAKAYNMVGAYNIPF